MGYSLHACWVHGRVSGQALPWPLMCGPWLCPLITGGSGRYKLHHTLLSSGLQTRVCKTQIRCLKNEMDDWGGGRGTVTYSTKAHKGLAFNVATPSSFLRETRNLGVFFHVYSSISPLLIPNRKGVGQKPAQLSGVHRDTLQGETCPEQRVPG